jgi:putative transposase
VEHRDRYFPPAVALGLFVSQVLSRGDACTTTVMRFNSDRQRRGLSPVCTDASAYCKARAKLPVKLIDTLSNRVVQMAHRKTSVQWKWRGRNAYLVDGLVLRAPDTEANQEGYPQPSSQEEGLGFPQVRMVVTTSLATGCITHYNTGPVEGKRTGEISLFRDKHAEFAAGDVIVADSNFESFHDAVLLDKRGVALVCCINGTRKSPFEGPCKTIEEKLVTIDKPKFDQTRFTRAEWKALPDSITYRVIRYLVSGGTSEITIVTTLWDAKLYPAEEIIELYGLRWDIELDIRSYKSTMGLMAPPLSEPFILERSASVVLVMPTAVSVTNSPQPTD